MNKVRYFEKYTGYALEDKINEFAKDHEIVQISVYLEVDKSVGAMVLYKA
ncbi:hypothetical protein SAMN05216392_0361 [Streptococcus equinus]|uniref:Uncharacterized protein n=1 Tax=Streptococcus equinus TaxID=1335 RepID=A0A1H0Y264_STREI|nr:hypothetical protein [Streptococcus equinus]QBX24858.1 hypothetical protein Javan214_0021 [Streptococcus phage Javan214]SDQ09016.1 hypothetical protein SAMN05216392_0361 [Streptococcus equinus]